MRPKRRPRAIARPDRPELGGALPGRVHEPGQGPAQRSGEGAGPAHAGMVGGPAAGPRTGLRWRAIGGCWVHSCRAAPPSGRRLRLRAAPSGTPAHRPPPVPAALRARCRRARDGHPPERQRIRSTACRPGPAATPTPSLPAVVDTDAAQRRHRADRALADRRERQAGHAELDLQPRPARPRARGLRQPGRARCPATTSPLFVNTTARAVQVQAYRMGYYQGLGGRLIVQTDFVAAKAQPAPVVTPGMGTVTLPVVAHPDAQRHEGLAARAATS